jgi:hypothetical protein
MHRACWGLLLMPLAGCAPKNIVKSTCHNDPLATSDPWACTLSGDSVDRTSSIEFDTESRNQVAEVKLAVAVKQGTLRLRYHDLDGEQQLTITPTTPAKVEMKTRLQRDRRSFTLYFEPVGQVGGVSGTVDYLTP